MSDKNYPEKLPAQTQKDQPGRQEPMQPQPVTARNYLAAGKLKGKVALITGGDSGIGRAVAVMFAKEGADVAISYLAEDKDAEKTKELIEAAGRKCLLLKGDIVDEGFCQDLVENAVAEFGKLNILVNNAAEQHETKSILDVSAEQLQRTFAVNIFAMFYLAKAALPHLHEGDSIINTASVTAYRGSGHLLDYSTTKGAIVSFTRSLAENLAPKKIRVNAVAPGPIWTPFIPSTMPPDQVENFGQDTLLGRPGQPEEVGPAFVFLASDDASYFTGQVLHPNGGEIVNT